MFQLPLMTCKTFPGYDEKEWLDMSPHKKRYLCDTAAKYFNSSTESRDSEACRLLKTYDAMFNMRRDQLLKQYTPRVVDMVKISEMLF